MRFHVKSSEIPDWSRDQPRLIPRWFKSHRIVSHDEKTYSFLNVFQLKSQILVTLGSISLFLFFRSLFLPPPPALSLCLSSSKPPTSLLLLAFAFRQERTKGEKNRCIPGIFLQQLLHHFSTKLKPLVYISFFPFSSGLSLYISSSTSTWIKI